MNELTIADLKVVPGCSAPLIHDLRLAETLA
jgi:hypothetical protein